MGNLVSCLDALFVRSVQTGIWNGAKVILASACMGILVLPLSGHAYGQTTYQTEAGDSVSKIPGDKPRVPKGALESFTAFNSCTVKSMLRGPPPWLGTSVVALSSVPPAKCRGEPKHIPIDYRQFESLESKYVFPDFAKHYHSTSAAHFWSHYSSPTKSGFALRTGVALIGLKLPQVEVPIEILRFQHDFATSRNESDLALKLGRTAVELGLSVLLQRKPGGQIALFFGKVTLDYLVTFHRPDLDDQFYNLL